MKRILMASCLALGISGCATSSNVPYEDLRDAKRPLYCEVGEECDLYWQRAEFFVNNFAGFRLQTLSDNTIQTYNPTEHSPRLAYTLSKEPGGESRPTRIWVKAYCANMFGCQPHHLTGIAQIKRYMQNGSQ